MQSSTRTIEHTQPGTGNNQHRKLQNLRKSRYAANGAKVVPSGTAGNAIGTDASKSYRSPVLKNGLQLG